MSTVNLPSDLSSDPIALLRQLAIQQQHTNLLLQNLSIHLAKAMHAVPAAAPHNADPNAEWRKANPKLAADCRRAADLLNEGFAEYIQIIADQIIGNDADFSGYTWNEFLDTCGPRVQHLTSLLGLLNQLGGNNSQTCS